jgi:GDP-fucose protein O-fucosyltransferase
MLRNTVAEMVTSLGRIKWYKYRYLLASVVVINILLINHFFFDTTITQFNPFSSSPDIDIEDETWPPIASALPSIPAAPAVAPTKPANPIKEQPAKPTKPDDDPKPAPPQIAVPPASSSTFNLHDYNFNGEYVGWPLERVCKESEFTPGLVFVCDNNSGGIGNIRNFILTCIRYAIDAGASGLILPKIQRRSEEELSNLFSTTFQPFEYFFNEQHFRDSMGKHCPQMVIYNELTDIPNHEQNMEIKEFYPKDLNVDLDGCDGRGVNRHLDMFRSKFYAWLKKRRRIPTAEEPVSIRFKWATFFEWPIYRDGPEFATTFGDLLRIRPDIAELAARTLSELSKFAGNPSLPEENKIDVPYLGVHLRTEADSLQMWPDYDMQSDGYLKQAELRGLKHAYLACGNASEAHRFAGKAREELNINVASKTDLLTGEDLKKLEDLSWDQQALVDFLVLTKSTHFTGCSFSSFTMNVAFKRHLMTGGINTRQWKSPGDEFTTLVGRFDSWYGDWMFMYECMWP